MITSIRSSSKYSSYRAREECALTRQAADRARRGLVAMVDEEDGVVVDYEVDREDVEARYDPSLVGHSQSWYIANKGWNCECMKNVVVGSARIVAINWEAGSYTCARLETWISLEKGGTVVWIFEAPFG